MTFVDSDAEDWRISLKSRSQSAGEDVERSVAETIRQVRNRGDEALIEMGRRYDSPSLARVDVTDEEIVKAELDPCAFQALQHAFDRIEEFHGLQMKAFTAGLERRAGGWSWQKTEEQIGQYVRPLRSAGLYVPGGLATYPSSVLMLAGPAKAAGVAQVSVCTPCRPDGSVSASVLCALRIAGVSKAYKAGGASAIAALALGTETIEKVDFIAGPGNRFVNEAKRQLWGTVGVDGLYGPSEVCVLFDSSANPEFVAADFLSQLEHAPDNLGFLVALDSGALERVQTAIASQMESAPRGSILKKCLESAVAFFTASKSTAVQIVDQIAPEHLSIATHDPDWFVDRISNAGCMLVGDWTPESTSDFCLGPSHTLPTSGGARFAGPINVLNFLKIQSVGHLERDQLQPLFSTVRRMAELEGFPAHAHASEIRRGQQSS